MIPGQIEVAWTVMEEADWVIRVSELLDPHSSTILSVLEELVLRFELPRVAEEVAYAGEEVLDGEEVEDSGTPEEATDEKSSQPGQAMFPVALTAGCKKSNNAGGTDPKGQVPPAVFWR